MRDGGAPAGVVVVVLVVAVVAVVAVASGQMLLVALLCRSAVTTCHWISDGAGELLSQFDVFPMDHIQPPFATSGPCEADASDSWWMADQVHRFIQGGFPPESGLNKLRVGSTKEGRHRGP